MGSAQSDLDLLVVLPDDIPVELALEQRLRFTSWYIELHLALKAQPDLRWPGEVIYVRDLKSTMAGGAYRAAPGELCLAPLTQPHRYWLTMVAASETLVDAPAHRAASKEAWFSMIAYAIYRKHAAGAEWMQHESMLRGNALRRLWGLKGRDFAFEAAVEGALVEARRQGLIKTRSSRSSTFSAEGLETWRKKQIVATEAPLLDQYQAQYRALAQQVTGSVGRYP